jgi:hypothetical protein
MIAYHGKSEVKEPNRPARLRTCQADMDYGDAA